MGALKIRRLRGILLVEAVIASFLFVFAFAAAAALFDTALRWETQGGNQRKAALAAERKMEELRALSRNVPSGSTFAAHLDSLIAGPHPPSDSFTYDVVALPNTHRVIPANGLTPTNGVHSPCSSFYTVPFAIPSALDPNGDAQRNDLYETYPYSRPMPNSYRLVQVTALYGTNNSREFRLVSLIGEPIVDTNTLSLNFTPATGTTLSAGGASTDFELEVQRPGGIVIEDISAIWNNTPNSSAQVTLTTLDSLGRQVRVNPISSGLPTGGRANVAAKVRYGGREFVGLSPDLTVNP